MDDKKGQFMILHCAINFCAEDFEKKKNRLTKIKIYYKKIFIQSLSINWFLNGNNETFS